jgi:hypothetical protein
MAYSHYAIGSIESPVEAETQHRGGDVWKSGGLMSRGIALIASAALALCLTGCAPLTIARINQDPSRFRNRIVHVDGTVVTSVGILGTGGYQIDDGTGKIFVLSRTGVPSSGSRVSVTGSVVNVAEVLGQPVGTAIREQSHKVK